MCVIHAQGPEHLHLVLVSILQYCLQHIGSLLCQLRRHVPHGGQQAIVRSLSAQQRAGPGVVREVAEPRADRAVGNRIDLGAGQVCRPSIEKVFDCNLFVFGEVETVTSVVIGDDPPRLIQQDTSCRAL